MLGSNDRQSLYIMILNTSYSVMSNNNRAIRDVRRIGFFFKL